MPDIDILNQMFKDTAKLAPESINGKIQVELSETKNQKSSVRVYNLPEKTIVIRADAFKSPDTIFNGAHGECKRADFIIVANSGKKKVILCIEMKGTNDSEREIIGQLKGAQCFVAYFREIGRAFWKQKKFLDGYAYRFISIRHISIPKRTTRIDRKSGIHDQPERMMKIDWPHHLEFHSLAGR